MRTFLLILNVFFSLGTFAQNTKTNTGMRKTTEALAFLIGQEYSLKAIESNFPKLKSAINTAELNFNYSFGRARTNINKFLLKQWSQEEIDNFKETLISKALQPSISSLTQEEAISFIENVNQRAKGEINSPILETLLFYQYVDQPEEEFIRGYVLHFNTKGHSKAKGTDWTIKVPLSWTSMEADRPNIIKKFISEGGSGNETITLSVMDIPLEKGKKISKTEIEAFFSENEIRQMVPKGGKLISYKKMTFDQIQGGALEFEYNAKQLDFNLKIRSIWYIFIYKNKIYNVQCGIGSEEGKRDLELDMQKFAPLFKLIANSIVVNEKYSK
ncbi:MAG: hypothetical protein L6Q78_05855 [Bacteroidia bacterium]|nr:hypothetical protein [Bacteroidia bacterium]